MLEVVLADKIKLSGGLRTNNVCQNDLLVSIVCVTLNAGETLPALLNSVRKYKTNRVEFVIIDGSSTDHTINIIEANEDVIDFWISKPDNGIYDAMNDSLNYINGNWVLFLGADDRLLNGFKNMLDQLQEPDTIYYGNLMFYGKEFAKHYNDYYLTKLNICQQGIFYPRAVFNKYHFDQKYRVYADYHLNLRCWRDPEFNFFHAGHLVSWFSDGGFSSYEKDIVFERDRDMLFKTYLKRSSYYRYLNRTKGFFAMLKMLLQPK
jgi:glycosyltransferase involved in cell wall biosynthesis